MGQLQRSAVCHSTCRGYTGLLCWVTFYTKSLRVPSIIGVVLFVLQIMFDNTLSFSVKWLNILRCIFCLYMVCWSTWFYHRWMQVERNQLTRWGILLHGGVGETILRERDSFKADFWMQDLINPKLWIKGAKFWKQRVRMSLSGILSVFLIFGCVIIVNGDVHTYLFNKLGWQEKIEHGLDDAPSWVLDFIDIPTIVTAVLVNVFDTLFSGMAAGLADFENHKFHTSYRDSLITKVFVFRSLDYYSPLWYIAFLKEHIDPCTDSPTGRCLRLLRRQLASLFVIGLVLSAVQVCKPLITRACKNRKKKTTDTEIEQERCDPYDGSLPEYETMVTQFGLVTLFSVVLPIVPALACLANHIEVKTDAIKLVKGTRRPFPEEVQDAGAWDWIIRSITLLGLLMNILLCVFGIMGKTYKLRFQLAVSLVLLIIGICLKETLAASVPEDSKDTKILNARAAFIEREIIFGE
eukprot:GHVO01070143.1.p1 GENE.GHVO01070143.1~~GHVO01070143.1.p1  ORF type:complete len:465 (-),score=73.05 GHVO01070143.1:49-1443(-)